MPEDLCGDCRFATNERPNLELKRRDFDCIGLPPQLHFLVNSAGNIKAQIGEKDTIIGTVQGTGQVTVNVARGAIVGGRDPACGLFKRRPLPTGTSLYERIAAAKVQSQETSELLAKPTEDQGRTA